MSSTDLMPSLKNLSDVLAILTHVAFGRGMNRDTKILVLAILISRERRRKKLQQASLSQRQAAFWLNKLMVSECLEEIRHWEGFWGKPIHKMTDKEVSAAYAEMGRELGGLLSNGPGRPSKQPTGLLYFESSRATKNNGGRPPKITHKQERCWVEMVMGTQLGLYQNIHPIKSGSFHDVIKFFVEHPDYLDEVRKDVPDVTAIEKLEKILCEEERRPYDPTKLPALKTRYSRARRPLKVVVKKPGVLR